MKIRVGKRTVEVPWITKDTELINGDKIAKKESFLVSKSSSYISPLATPKASTKRRYS